MIFPRDMVFLKGLIRVLTGLSVSEKGALHFNVWGCCSRFPEYLTYIFLHTGSNWWRDCWRTFTRDVVTIENSEMTWYDATPLRSDEDEDTRIC